MLALTLRAPELAQLLSADPRRYFQDCGIIVPPDVTVEVHQTSAKNIHLVLPAPLFLPLDNREGKVDITDADLVSGAAVAMLKWWSNAKADAKDKRGKIPPGGGKTRDADDKSDQGAWFNDDKGDTKDAPDAWYKDKDTD